MRGRIGRDLCPVSHGIPGDSSAGSRNVGRHRYWARCFTPFPLVVIPADGDKAGKALAKAVAADLPQLRIAHMPTGRDANDVLQSEGVEGFMRRCDLEDYLVQED